MMPEGRTQSGPFLFSSHTKTKAQPIEQNGTIRGVETSGDGLDLARAVSPRGGSKPRVALMLRWTSQVHARMAKDDEVTSGKWTVSPKVVVCIVQVSSSLISESGRPHLAFALHRKRRHGAQGVDQRVGEGWAVDGAGARAQPREGWRL